MSCDMLYLKWNAINRDSNFCCSFHPLCLKLQIPGSTPSSSASTMLDASCGAIVPCSRNPLSLLGNLVDYPSDLLLNWQGSAQNTAQSPSLSSRWSASQYRNLGIVLGTTRNPVPLHNEHVSRCEGNIVSGNGQVAEGWSKMAVCSVLFHLFHLFFSPLLPHML